MTHGGGLCYPQSAFNVRALSPTRHLEVEQSLTDKNRHSRSKRKNSQQWHNPGEAETEERYQSLEYEPDREQQHSQISIELHWNRIGLSLLTLGWREDSVPGLFLIRISASSNYEKL